MWRSLTKTIGPLSKSANNLLFTENSLQQQIRTTFILKRRIDPPLSKRGHPRKKLRTRHYLYELVKDTNQDKQSEIDLILTSYVDGLGNPGDRVSVKSYYAYDHLLVPGLAVYATPDNLDKYKEGELGKKTYSSSTALQMMKLLSNVCVSLVMNKDSPWTIQPWHVSASLRKCGYVVPEYAITVPEKPIKGPDLDIEGKEFYVTVTINKTEQVKVRCRIHHWSTDIKERLPYEEGFWKVPGELLFPEDKEIAKEQSQNT